MLRLRFGNVHVDGKLVTRWDRLLRICGDFEVSVDDRVLFQEQVHFPLVEFALELARWLVTASDGGADMIYTSLEADTVGLVHFARGPDGWRVTAGWEDERKTSAPLGLERLRLGSIAYLTTLRDVLRADPAIRLDLLGIIEDQNREALRAIFDSD
jgi:hypothetical protein